ncbi:hypothetical protein [Halohasta salina]|uniref:hypothetical protein n=1 Tax=Halohasta salina TaxID=2961621 RepID=UPI0020A5C5C5|nr:hypothetical protein [Halohasta salina]
MAALIALLLVYWLIDELGEAEDREELAAGVGRRASGAVQAGARNTRRATVGLAGLGAALGVEAMQLGAGLNEVLGGFPVVLGHVIYGGISLLGIGGYIPFDAQLAGFTFVFVTAIALVLRATNDPEEI